MAAEIIGKALIVAWSFTLTNLGSTPQIINLGPAPTVSNYIPVELIIRDAKMKDADGLTMSFGTDSKKPNNVFGPYQIISKSMNQNINGYRTWDMGGKAIAPADQNLYVEYSLPKAYPASDKPITIDVLAYPTN